MDAIPEVQSGVLFSAVVVWEHSCQGRGADGRLDVLFMGMGACDCASRCSGPGVFPRGALQRVQMYPERRAFMEPDKRGGPSDGLCPAQAEQSV